MIWLQGKLPILIFNYCYQIFFAPLWTDRDVLFTQSNWTLPDLANRRIKRMAAASDWVSPRRRHRQIAPDLLHEQGPILGRFLDQRFWTRRAGVEPARAAEWLCGRAEWNVEGVQGVTPVTNGKSVFLKMKSFIFGEKTHTWAWSKKGLTDIILHI